MVTLAGGKRAAKKGAKLSDHWTPAVNAPHVVPEPIAALLSDDLLYNRERAYAMHAAEQFESWLLHHIAENRIPLDEVLRPTRLLILWVKLSLLLRIEHPEWFVSDTPADDFWFPENESEAVALGLSIKKPSKERIAPALPGCLGTGENNGPCTRLRRFGEKYCPTCRRKELRRLRSRADGGR